MLMALGVAIAVLLAAVALADYTGQKIFTFHGFRWSRPRGRSDRTSEHGGQPGRGSRRRNE